MISGILFDFNGTMLYDKAFHDAAWRTFLEGQISRDITHEEFVTHICGRSATDILTYFLERAFTPAEAIETEEQKERIYRRLLTESDQFHLAPGLPAYLDALQENGIPFTIATASGQINTEFFFTHLHLGKWLRFENIVYNDGSFPGKPAPDIFLRAAKRIGIPIGECAVFEDAPSGIQAAKRAGAGQIVGVASMLSPEELTVLGADMTIMDYRQKEGLPCI